MTDVSSTAPPPAAGTQPISPIGGTPTNTTTDIERERGLEQIRDWAREAARAADAKGGDDTVILEIGAVLAITDAFVITSGRNHRQVQTIADEVEAKVKACGGPGPLRTEGRHEAEWILLDYGDFVVHVFLDETRSFYDLERLWSDAPRVAWSEPAVAGTAASGSSRAE